MSVRPRVLRAAAVAALFFLAAPGGGRAQQVPAAAAADRDEHRPRFSSFDVGFGGVFPEGAETGLSYAVAVDGANLLMKGTQLRFGFRFWSSRDTNRQGERVDLDDTTVGFIFKAGFGGRGARGYVGLGPGLHFVSARVGEFTEQREARDGFRPGLDGVVGVEIPLSDAGFLSAFGEALGSLVSRVSHVSAHVGLRIRFDRLGTGG